MLAGMAALALLGRPLDALAMGEDEARGPRPSWRYALARSRWRRWYRR